MDYLLLFTPTKTSHFAKLEDLLNALCKNGLKISPKECQLFKTELQYMGNTIFIKGKRVCLKPLRSRIEVIQKLKPPTMITGCRGFAGMMNFVSRFCPELQKLFKPIYDLIRKGRQLILGEEQQVAFEEIKSRLQKKTQFCICQIRREDSNYTSIPAKLLPEVHYIKFRMVGQNSLPLQGKDC